MRVSALLLLLSAGLLSAVERLDRGVYVQRLSGQRVMVTWRLLPGEPTDTGFLVDRTMLRDGLPSRPTQLTAQPITNATCWVTEAPSDRCHYVVRRADGQGPSGSAEPRDYLAIPLRTPPDYHPGDAAAGDLDGDGQMDIVLKQEQRGFDNSQSGVCPAPTLLQAYRLDGTMLWQIDLGPNIRTGAHYTPFLVYDFDGDGRAEVAVRTAEGTKDGAGKVIGDTDGDGRTNYVNEKTGYILEGPEFLSVFDGQTGAERARVPYIARGKVSDWGDNYGNRVDRFLMAVAYLDGQHPSLVACRGYYALTKLEAWDLADLGLKRRWAFSSADPGNAKYAGQGNHNLAAADVDGDGRDEIVYGACAIDDNGKGLYSTGLGHGDAIHLGDLDPDRPGLELFDIHEEKPCPAGWELRDPATGKLLWGLPTARDTGRGMAADIDPRHRGYEIWAGGGPTGLYDVKGNKISEARPRSCNMGIWWDGDLLTELLDGTTIQKWDWQTGETKVLLDTKDQGCVSINSTKANPCLYGDLLGDWREEVLWPTADGKQLRLYATTEPTEHRFTTLLADHVYRLSLAHQNIGYNQPNHVGFYLGAP